MDFKIKECAMNFLNPTTDIVFKKLFGSTEHSQVLISFLNSILMRKEGEKIVSVVINNPYNAQRCKEDKLSIVDVCCTDQTGFQYIVEMQATYQDDFGTRAQYYSAIALARQLKRGDQYDKADPVIFIGVLDFKLFKTDHYISHHLILDTDTHEHALRHLEFHFIELPKFTKEIDALDGDVDAWTYFLKNASEFRGIPKELQKTTAMEEAFHIVEEANWTNEELYTYEKLIDLERQDKSKLDSAERIGFQEGKEKGIKEGIEEGQLKEKHTIAQSLLDVLDVETIAKKTGLSVDEIKKLQK